MTSLTYQGQHLTGHSPPQPVLGAPWIEVNLASSEKDPMQFTHQVNHFSDCILRDRTPRHPRRNRPRRPARPSKPSTAPPASSSSIAAPSSTLPSPSLPPTASSGTNSRRQRRIERTILLPIPAGNNVIPCNLRRRALPPRHLEPRVKHGRATRDSPRPRAHPPVPVVPRHIRRHRLLQSSSVPNPDPAVCRSNSIAPPKFSVLFWNIPQYRTTCATGGTGVGTGTGPGMGIGTGATRPAVAPAVVFVTVNPMPSIPFVNAPVKVCPSHVPY